MLLQLSRIEISTSGMKILASGMKVDPSGMKILVSRMEVDPPGMKISVSGMKILRQYAGLKGINLPESRIM
jgi:hypothetical protein